MPSNVYLKYGRVNADDRFDIVEFLLTVNHYLGIRYFGLGRPTAVVVAFTQKVSSFVSSMILAGMGPASNCRQMNRTLVRRTT
jgi:hypothetical protein